MRQSAHRSMTALLAAGTLAAGLSGAAQAGGLASLCAEYETRSVSGIIENLLTDVDDCVRIAVAPDDSPRPVPRPVLLAALPAPVFLPESDLVTAAMGAPILIGGGSVLTPNSGGSGGGGGGGGGFVIGGGGGSGSGSDGGAQIGGGDGGGSGGGGGGGGSGSGSGGGAQTGGGGGGSGGGGSGGGGGGSGGGDGPGVSAVPLPAGFWLLGLAIASVLGLRRRRAATA